MKILQCKITITKENDPAPNTNDPAKGTQFVFTYVKDLTIKTSWESFTDTAVIELPNNIFNRDNRTISSVISVGDRVEIQLGYSPILVTRFKGWVSRIEPDSPAKIFCEDEAYF